MKGWTVHMEMVRNDHIEVGRNFIIYDMRRSGSSGSGTPAWRLFTDAMQPLTITEDVVFEAWLSVTG